MSESKGGESKGEASRKLVIDWEEAMVQVGGDEEFLGEVLGDLLSESKTAEDEISKSFVKWWRVFRWNPF